MDREEIVKNTETKKKSKQEFNGTAMRFGWLCVTVVIIIIGMFRFFHNESIADLLMIITVHIASTSGYQYLRTKNKNYLLTTIVGTIALGLAFAALLSEYGVY